MASDTDQAKLDGAEERPLPSQRESAAQLGEDRPAREDTTYVVQVERKGLRWVDTDGEIVGEPATAWMDVATVKVPPRTRRATVIPAALKEAGIKPGDGEQPRVRVLDEASAAVEQPEAEWVVS